MARGPDFSRQDLARLRRTQRLTVWLAAGALAVFAVLGLTLVHGGWVALNLGRTGTALLAAGGLVVLALASAVTVHLVRRQRAILNAARTLLDLTESE